MIERKLWQKILKKYPEANFLQSPEWAEVNQKIGHKIITKAFYDRALFLAIIKDAKRGRYLEVPGGPLMDWSDSDMVKHIFAELRQIAKANKCAFIRFRPQLKNTPENLALLPDDAKPAPFHLHAEHTVMIDLEKTEDELLKAMRRQTRYEVRRSMKQRLVVEKSNSKEIFEIFHEIQSETAARQNFIPPRLNDLLAYRSAFGPNATIYYAYADETAEGERVEQPFSGGALRRSRPSHSGPTPATAGGGNRGDAENVLLDSRAIIALGLIIKSGNEADYFEAASTDLNRKLPGAYALQWQAIKDLKSQGVKRYNLWGIAPKGQPNHRYAKVTTFKTGFGGQQIEYIPAHDIIISKPKYLKTYLIETIRKKRRHLS